MTIKFETLLLIAMLFLVRDRGFQGSVFRKLQETEAGVQSDESSSGYNFENKITPLPDICPEGFPSLHANLHDRRPEHKHHYEQTVGEQTRLWNARGDDTPQIEVRQNVKFAVWKSKRPYQTESSVWNPSNSSDYVKGAGWRNPIFPDRPWTNLQGDWVAFTTWHLNQYGHFAHDHLATIAYLRTIVPETTRFLLVDCPINRKVFQFLDPDFVKRVKWFIRDNVFHIEGNLTVAIPLSVPIVFGCCGAFDPMRQWVAEMHPDRPAKKLVIYYSRGGSTDTSHGRIIDISLEKEIIEYIRAAMQRHGKKEDLVVFNGQFEGRTMPIERQFALFRSASTIIGPHGTGIGGNFVWTNPFSRTCEERTQLLEFITGQESAQVQNLYATYNVVRYSKFANFRKWPLDYHSILYTKESNRQTTFIDLQDLDDALDFMWGKSTVAAPQ